MSQQGEANETKHKRVTGQGKNLSEALNKAIQLAEKTITVPDGTCKWKLIEISGETGGFLIYKVTIELLHNAVGTVV